MKLTTFLVLLFALGLMILVVVAAPYLGLGSGYDFILWRHFGIGRAVLITYPETAIYILVILFVLGIGVEETTLGGKMRAGGKRAWQEGKIIGGELIANAEEAYSSPRAWLYVGLILVGSAFAFATFISKYLAIFKLGIDQHWHQALIDYDIEWRAPAFSFAGNLLNQFGIQLPLKPSLLPLEGLATLAPVQHHIVAAVALIYVAMCGLFWAIGLAIGLRPAPRAVFASAVALLTTVPYGIDTLIWFLPPNFLTSQFSLALWWQEAPILTLTAALAFYWLGQSAALWKKSLAAVIFSLGCLETVVGFPTGGVYFIPILGLYCLGLLITVSGRSELLWKVTTGGLVVIAFLILRVPKFFAGLYGYSFGAYFGEATKVGTIDLIWVNFIVTVHGIELRGLIVFVVSFSALIVASLYGSGGMRRLAIAALVCEAGIIMIGTFNAFTIRAPIGFAYAEIATSPLWVSYFVLALMVCAVMIGRRLGAQLEAWPAPRRWSGLGWAIKRRGNIAIIASILVLGAYAVRKDKETHFSDYPPARPLGAQIMEREVKLQAGRPYAGAVFTLIQPGIPGGDQNTVMDVVANAYRKNLGNDFLIDLPALMIPTIYQHAHWTSPVTFAFLRSFFGRQTDPFSKAFFPLRAYDPKIARLMGVRMVVTDDKAFSDGVLIHEEMAGGSPLRIFRIDNVNLGQYSPTRPRQVSSAAEAIAALRQTSFDAARDVVVEEDIASDLVPANSSSIVTDYGPALVVSGTSNGRSLLVLPFEYSHCLHIEASEGSRARLVPVNLQQIGLMFEKSVDARITYRFGLLKDASCRSDDIARADRLRLREIVSWPR